MIGVTVVTGLITETIDNVSKAIATELRDYENMEIVGQIHIKGNLPCITCGDGDRCKMSGLKMLYGPDAKTEDIEYIQVEKQKKVWEEGKRIGAFIGDRIRCRKTF